jgi:SsrA-binding protein
LYQYYGFEVSEISVKRYFPIHFLKKISNQLFMAKSIDIKNKKAWHDYELTDKYTAGIELSGTEIKSIRAGKASLTDSFCFFLQMPGKPDVVELWVKMHIAEYVFGTYNNHEPKRDRKLLLNRREINKLHKAIKATGLTIIPTRLYINDNGFAKLEISVARGKKFHDKREDLKSKDAGREMDKMKKSRG